MYDVVYRMVSYGSIGNHVLHGCEQGLTTGSWATKGNKGGTMNDRRNNNSL